MGRARLLCFLLLAASAQAIRISSNSDHASSPCDGCEVTVNLRCEGIRSHRGAPYHRIQDCILPLYQLIELARNASMVNQSKVCAITWKDPWEGLGLQPLLKNVSQIPWHSIINEREECTKSLRYHAVNRTKWLMAKDDYLQSLGSDPNMIQALRINISSNLASIQRDASKFTGPEGDRTGIVLLSRDTGARMFRPVARQALIRSLESHTGRHVTAYLGHETFVETLKMFNRAAGIIGYHGAAWANTYFTGQRHCNVQISTFFDLNSTTKWRISSELMLNERGTWSFYYLPLKLLLDANHVLLPAYEQREEKDHFIKDLPWIPLRRVDIEEVTSQMGSCIVDPASFRAAHPAPENATLTRGWSHKDSVLPIGLSTAGSIPEARDNCTGCDFTVDLRCSGMRVGRHDYHNMLTQCLFPSYEMFQLAREVASNESANVCAITWNTKNGFTLQPFLSDFVGIKWHKIIDEADPCTKDLHYHAPNRTEEWGVSRDFQLRFAADSKLVTSYPIDKTWNLKWLLQDAINIAGSPNPWIILLQNQKKGVFLPDAFTALTRRLQGVGLPVRIFNGDASVVDTVKLFTNTGAIVGYHGPLWANSIMVTTPHCIFQYSTFEDFEKQKSWRTTQDIRQLNTNGEWHYYHLPVQSMLAGNNVTRDAFNRTADKDHFLLDLPWVPLEEEENHEAAISVRLCWQSKWIAYRRQLVAFGKSGNNQDHGY